MAILSLLLTAPSKFFAARYQQLASRCLILAFRSLILISHTLPFAAQCFRMLFSLSPGWYSRVIFCFLLSSILLFAGFNSTLFIVNRYRPPTARLSYSLLENSQTQLADSLLLAVCYFPLAAPPSHLISLSTPFDLFLLWAHRQM